VVMPAAHEEDTEHPGVEACGGCVHECVLLVYRTMHNDIS
jgi:hypothetical protein